MGRKREMKLVEGMTSRKVTFSKRKKGLFKKADELATLCGSEIAVVMFSPAGKPFSFGYPNVKLVTDRFFNVAPNSRVESGDADINCKGGELENLKQELIYLEDQLKNEMEKGKSLGKEKNENGVTQEVLLSRYNSDVFKWKKSLEKLQDDLKTYVSEVEASSALLLLAEKPVLQLGKVSTQTA